MATSEGQVPKRSRVNTRARLLDAAYDVFAERGFQSATVEDICARAGFTRGAFYSNFSTTDELFLALWDRKADQLVSNVRLMVEMMADIPDPLDLAQAALIDVELVTPDWFVLNTEFLLHALRHPDVAEELSRHRVRLRQELMAAMAVVLEVEHRRVPDEIDLELLTRMVIAAHEGCQHQSLVAGHELAPGQLQRTMLTLLIQTCPPIEDEA